MKKKICGLLLVSVLPVLCLAKSMEINEFLQIHAIERGSLTPQSMAGKPSAAISIKRFGERDKGDPLPKILDVIGTAPIMELGRGDCFLTKERSKFDAITGSKVINIRSSKDNMLSETTSDSLKLLKNQAQWLLFSTLRIDQNGLRRVSASEVMKDKHFQDAIAYQNAPASRWLQLEQKAQCAPFGFSGEALKEFAGVGSDELLRELEELASSEAFHEKNNYFANVLKMRAGQELQKLKQLFEKLKSEESNLQVREYIVYRPYQEVRIIKECIGKTKKITTVSKCEFR